MIQTKQIEAAFCGKSLSPVFLESFLLLPTLKLDFLPLSQEVLNSVHLLVSANLAPLLQQSVVSIYK